MTRTRGTTAPAVKSQQWKDGHIAGYKEAEKAYGSCHFCYGKGYSEIKLMTISAYGFARAKKSSEEMRIVKSPEKDGVAFCSCERAERLKKLWGAPTV